MTIKANKEYLMPTLATPKAQIEDFLNDLNSLSPFCLVMLNNEKEQKHCFEVIHSIKLTTFRNKFPDTTNYGKKQLELVLYLDKNIKKINKIISSFKQKERTDYEDLAALLLNTFEKIHKTVRRKLG